MLDETQLHFGHDSSSLSPEARQTIRQLAKDLQGRPITHIRITGHTDNTGTPAYNQQLSLTRAEAVKTALAEYLNSKEIQYIVSGVGAGHPIGSNITEAGKAKNRKVEIEIE